MSRFDDCLTFVLKREGGYSNHAEDHGGATNKGITQVTYDEWRIRNGLPRNPVSGISGEEVSAIYAAGYWRPSGADRVNDPLDLVLFDSAIQHGAGRAAKWLQRVVGTLPDGQIGQKTLDAVAAFAGRNGMALLVDDYLAIRDGFYHEIVENDRSQAVFLGGWMHRMAALRQAFKGA